jgi:hypothetical protein
MAQYINALLNDVKESASLNMKVFNKYVNRNKTFTSDNLEMDFDNLAYDIRDSFSDTEDDE